MKTGRCGDGTDKPGCGAEFYWLKHTGTGKPAPIDIEPSEQGNCAIDLKREVYWIPGKAGAVEYAGELHTNHWFSCPEREEWRRVVAEKRSRPA